METTLLELTEVELQVTRQALDIIQLNGKDAKLIASLQTKLENSILEITQRKETGKKKG